MIYMENKYLNLVEQNQMEVIIYLELILEFNLHIAIIGGFYTFNKNLDPIKVFKRFFGSDNPFRALDGIYFNITLFNLNCI